MLSERLNSIKKRLAQSFNTQSFILKLLAYDKDIDIRKLVSKNPKTNAEALLVLSKDKNPDIRKEVARHKNSTRKILRILLNDKCNEVRMLLASNPNLPLDIFSILEFDKENKVVETLLKNPNCPATVLDHFVNETNPNFRYLTVIHKNISPFALRIFARDGSIIIKKAVALNTSTPDDILIELSKDKTLNHNERVILMEALNKNPKYQKIV